MRARLRFVSLASVAVIPLLGAGSWLPTGRALWSRLFGSQQAPSVSPDVYNSGYPIERSACLTISLGPSAAAECGNLRLVHALPSVRTFNKLRTPTLLYNSEFAHPYPAVPVVVTISSSTTTPDYVEVVLSLKINGSYVPKVTRTWAGSEWPSGQTSTRRVTIAYDALNDSTGYYPYKVEVTNLYPAGVRMPGTPYTGKMFLINRKASPFGAGWWLAGLDKLINLGTNADVPEKVWIAGDGSARFFLQHPTLPNTWYTPLYERVDTLFYDTGTSTWTKTEAAGLRTKFDATGNHIQTIDRLGRTTTFSYSSGRLQTITIPPNSLSFQFAYTGGVLDSVTAPPIGTTGRVSRIIRSGALITGIRNPGDSVVSFGFLTGLADSNLISKRLNRRAVVDTFTYDSARRVRTSTIRMGSGSTDVVWTLLAGETRGLPASGTPSSVDTVKAYTKLDGPRTDKADTTVLYQSRFGPPRRIIDALAGETIVKHGPDCGGIACGWLALRLQSPLGRVLLATYDSHGNPIQLIDSVTAVPLQQDTTGYAWDGKFDQLTMIDPPEHDTTVFNVSTSNGNRLWQQPGSDSSRRVTFDYYASGTGLGLLRATGVPGGVRDSLTYDATNANLSGIKTPSGQWTQFDRDEIGRETVVSRDITIGGGSKQVDTTGYSLRDEVLSTKSFGPAMNGASGESLRTTRTYDAEGRLLSLQRSSTPDAASIGTIATTWQYDNAGRPVSEIASDGRKDTTSYDPAGNAVAVVTRRGLRIGQAYDELNRKTSDTLPAVSYPSAEVGIASRPGADYYLPAYSYTVSGDTLRYTYDAAGNLLTANNRNAQVTRSYDVKGMISTDSLRIRDASGTSFSNHVYGISNSYDRNGRRTRLRIPTQLGIGGADSIRFAYNARLGLLSTIFDLSSNQYRITYDLRLQVDSVVHPGSIIRRLLYDNDERLAIDSIKNTGATSFPRHPTAYLRSSSYSYDATGRNTLSTEMAAFKDTLRADYSGLGHLVKGTLVERSHWLGTDSLSLGRFVSADSVRYDALGNITRTRHADTTWREKENIGFLNARNGVRGSAHESSTGRLLRDTLVTGKRTLTYDSAGNVRFSMLDIDLAGPLEDRASYFAADQRLAATDWRYVTVGDALPGRPAMRQFVEYRYDALGRRIWEYSQSSCVTNSTINDFARMACQLGTIKRYVWDGNQELVEIQMPLSAVTPASPLENDTTTTKVDKFLIDGAKRGDPNPFFGRVVYVPGLTVDQPLAVTRIGYTDWPVLLPPDTTYKNDWGPFTLVPFWNSRGVAPDGVFSDGTRYKYTGSGLCDPLQNTTRCVALPWTVDWSAYDRSRKALPPPAWHGGLLEDKIDKAGLNYRRNRYYDPLTSRFTQEDPIGLAGGLNLYGFSDGDPVNFSDSFGMCTAKDNWTDCAADFWIARARRSSGVIRRLGNWGMATLATVGDALVEAAEFYGGAAVGSCTSRECQLTSMIGAVASVRWPAGLAGERRAVEAVLKGKGALEGLSPEVRQQAAEFYRSVAETVGGNYARQARAFNLERARYLLEGGDIPPGTLPEFIRRLKP